MTNSTDEHRQQPEPSPRPWKIHNTGSYLAIKDAGGKFVIRKTTNQLAFDQFKQLYADFDLIVRRVNHKETIQ